jgi:hypothetical protein
MYCEAAHMLTGDDMAGVSYRAAAKAGGGELTFVGGFAEVDGTEGCAGIPGGAIAAACAAQGPSEGLRPPQDDIFELSRP